MTDGKDGQLSLSFVQSLVGVTRQKVTVAGLVGLSSSPCCVDVEEVPGAKVGGGDRRWLRLESKHDFRQTETVPACRKTLKSRRDSEILPV